MNHKLYSYTDSLGRRKFIYANDLTELREKEQKLQRDQIDWLDLYAQGKATINDTFDRYISTKYELRDSTKDFQFNRVEIDCRTENEASRRVIEKCGLTYEGVFRDFFWRKDHYEGRRVFSILNEEYYRRCKK